MALAKGDWSVAANGNIREVTGTSTHEVIELHRFLMGLLDDTTATDDDLVDVSNGIIPSARSTDQIITLNQPYNIDDTVAERFYGGSITYNGGDDVYSGLQVVGQVESGTQPEIIRNNVLVTNFWGSNLNAVPAENIIIQILLKTRTAGADIDGKRVRVQARELGDTYAEYSLTLGESFGVAALFTNPDDFNTTAEATIATWSTISNTTEGYNAIDVNGDGTDEYYYSKWTKGSQTEAQLFERAKWITRRGTSETLYGMSGSLFRGITHEINVDNILSGPLSAVETLTWTESSVSSSGRMLATDSTSAPTKVWIQLLTGIAPTDGTTLTGSTSGATVDVNVTVTTRPVNTNCFLGNYTGSLTGAFGVGVTAAELENTTDRMRALDNTVYQPPNNVDLIATGVAVGDTIFAAKTKTDTDTVSGSYSIGDTAITLSTSVPTDYNQIGRIFINDIEYVYVSYSGAVITLAAPGLTEALSGGEDTSLTQFYTDEFTSHATNNTVNSTTLEATTSFGSAWTSSGYVWVWDGVDRFHEYAYSSYTGAVLTLDSHTSLTMDGASTTTTVIHDTTATFQTWGLKQGTRIYNTTRTASSTVLSVDSETQLTLANAIASQTQNDGYEINTLVQAYNSQDMFLAFASEVATSTTITKSITYSTDVPGRWRLYNSAANITPFEVNFLIGTNGSSTPLTRISDA